MIELYPRVQYDIAKKMETSPALYPFNRREIRVDNLPVGFTSGTLDNLFLSQLPSRILVAMVRADSYNGAKTKNPFKFSNFGLSRIELSVNNNTISTYTPSFEKTQGNDVAPSYLSLFDAFGELGNNFSNDISIYDYTNDYNM